MKETTRQALDDLKRMRRQRGSIILKINGKTVRCEVCGAMVFFKLGNNRYECNGCLTVYVGEK